MIAPGEPTASPPQPGAEDGEDTSPPRPASRDGGDVDEAMDVPAPVDALPDEVLLHVLSCVPVADLLLRVPLVCKRFRRLCYDPQVWRHQELHYRACMSDEEFAELVRVVPLPRLGKLDLTGITAGSVAEKAIENAIVEPYSARGLKLVLSDEMDCSVAAQLVARLLDSLTSLHVGALPMKRESYFRLIRLVRESTRLRELRLAATVELPLQSAYVYFNDCNRDHADWECHDTVERLELWSEGGEMSLAMQAGACCILRTNKKSLRFVSHEYMSSKRPPSAQERRIMDAVGKCERLQEARVWSSHRLKVLEDCPELTSLTLSCDGECDRRLEPDPPPPENNQGNQGNNGPHIIIQNYVPQHLNNQQQDEQVHQHNPQQAPVLLHNYMGHLNGQHHFLFQGDAHFGHAGPVANGVIALVLPGYGQAGNGGVPIAIVVHAHLDQNLVQPIEPGALNGLPMFGEPEGHDFAAHPVYQGADAPGAPGLVVVTFGGFGFGMFAVHGVVTYNAPQMGLIGFFVPHGFQLPPNLPAGPLAHVVVAGGRVALLPGPQDHALYGLYENGWVTVLGDAGPIMLIQAQGQVHLALNWLNMLQQAVEPHNQPGQAGNGPDNGPGDGPGPGAQDPPDGEGEAGNGQQDQEPAQQDPADPPEDRFTCVELFQESPLLPRLKRLCLRLMDCDKVSPLGHVAARCPDLEELTLHCLKTDSHLNANLSMLTNLRRLTLIGVHYLHPDSLEQWTENTLPSLERLTLIGANRMPCPWKCWAAAVIRLRSMRPNLVIAVKECKHFRSV
ncbi:uncharacterized protein LOC117650074 [Thrips palmi]|uniref:Uncharacterized protein LOC117650074 n=1 Tax=Thrips palmi TaxID=161013 RepID=A0A6P8ZVT2_THRPL|nr:uncharacterized protein LOC117650074 [Thrips palmi]